MVRSQRPIRIDSGRFMGLGCEIKAILASIAVQGALTSGSAGRTTRKMQVGQPADYVKHAYLLVLMKTRVQP